MLARFIITAIAIFAGGCANTVDIDLGDRVEFTHLASSVPVEQGSPTRLQFRYSGTEGEDSQTLEPGERIRIGSDRIDGPAEVDSTLELEYFSVAIGQEARSQDGLILRQYYGISQVKFDLELSESGQRFTDRDSSTGFYFQLGVGTRFRDSLDLNFDWAFSLGSELSGINELELRAEYRLARNLALAGGYRWLEYQHDLGGEDSGLEVDFHGPFLGLNFPF